MAGSEAEERIRLKAEAFLRQCYPDARIIHELVLEQGGNRIDLAAVMPHGMVAVEIKSERDVFDRLQKQLKAALKVSQRVIICLAEKQAEKIGKLSDYDCEDRIPEISRCDVFWESPEADGKLVPYGNYGHSWNTNRVINAQDVLHMLWAPELRAVCYDMGVGQRATRFHCIAQASELLTGKEARRRAMAQIRSRPFPRADAPISEKQSEPVVAPAYN